MKYIRVMEAMLGGSSMCNQSVQEIYLYKIADSSNSMHIHLHLSFSLESVVLV